MAQKKELTDENIIIAGFCGVKQFRKFFRVSNAQGEKIVKDARTYTDPLVKFYAKIARKEYVFTHFYLTFTGRGKGFKEEDLVDTKKYIPAFNAIQTEIIIPTIERLALPLAELLDADNRISSPQRRLLGYLLGNPTHYQWATSAVYSIFCEALHTMYLSESPIFMISNACPHAEYLSRTKLCRKILAGDLFSAFFAPFTFPIFEEEKMQDVLSVAILALTDDQQSVIRYRYGLYPENARSIALTAQGLVMAPEEVKLMEIEAIELMRNPDNLHKSRIESTLRPFKYLLQ